MKVSEVRTMQTVDGKRKYLIEGYDVTGLLDHYSDYKQRLLRRRMPILTDALDILRLQLGDPALSIFDLRQMTAVMLEGNLSDIERSRLIRHLYAEIHGNPQWTSRGNVEWIERQIRAYKERRQQERAWRSSLPPANAPALPVAA